MRVAAAAVTFVLDMQHFKGTGALLQYRRASLEEKDAEEKKGVQNPPKNEKT